jgi:hypothetical protein
MFILFSMSCICLLSVRPVFAQTSSYAELQAAYIFNFAKYIKWPGSRLTFVIGIYGESDIEKELRLAMNEKKVGGHSIEIRIITSIEQISECNIIYLPRASSRELNLVRTSSGGKNVLIVTEEDLIKKGASISFVVEDDRLKFKLKRSALKESGLMATDGLLKIAIVL